jgi:diguanylate cyclase (GGDEF)-like protein
MPENGFRMREIKMELLQQAEFTKTLKVYLRILLQRWWLILIALLATLGITAAFTFSQPRIYQAETTFVVRPRANLIVDDEFVKALGTLSRSVEISTTYAEIANSNLIKNQAIKKLGLSGQQGAGLSVSGKLLAGTNILRIVAEGNNPELVRKFADAVGVETKNYINNLYDVFDLELLDTAELPRLPVSPNVALNLVLGAFLGFFLGLTLIFLAEYLQKPVRPFSEFNILDLNTGSYNKPYFTQRVDEEVSRVKRANLMFSLALLRVKADEWASDQTDQDWEEVMRWVKSIAEPYLREEDILARFNEDTFAVLLPNLDGEAAKNIMDELRLKIRTRSLENDGTNGGLTVFTSASVVAYQPNTMVNSREELLDIASIILRDADKAPHGDIQMFTFSHNGSVQTRKTSRTRSKQLS